jgi:hypothetical protein
MSVSLSASSVACGHVTTTTMMMVVVVVVMMVVVMMTAAMTGHENDGRKACDCRP